MWKNKLEDVLGSGRTAWAWGFSLLAHLGLFAAFAMTQFTDARANERPGPPPMMTVSRVREFIQAEPVIKKPKLKAEDMPVAAVQRPEETPLEALKEITQSASALEELRDIDETQSLATENLFAFEQTEFFGQATSQRKICYVVDASGSMQGLFSGVKKALKESVASLRQDQFFYIIFFSGENFLESGSGRMSRASTSAKASAISFIDTVRPAGTTHAFKALTRGMQIRDFGGEPPEQIYFLTDGLDMTSGDLTNLPALVEAQRKKLAPRSLIHCIGFWTEEPDQETLRRIASASGGAFKNIAN